MRIKNAKALSAAVILFIITLVGITQVPWKPMPTATPETILRVVDDFGRNVSITKIPARIVSLAPGNTETLFALGLGSKVVGVTRLCDYPPEVPERVGIGDIKVIGGYANPSIERIVALEPDLVLASGSLQRKTVDLLEEKGLRVVALNPKTIDQVLQNIRLVGKICGVAKKADELAESLEKRIGFVVSRVSGETKKPRIYYEIWHSPLMSAGPGTWVHELVSLAGGLNIFSDAKQPYPVISSETVIQRNPEIIIIKVGYMGEVAKEEIKRRPGWAVIDAVKNDRIYELEENIVIRPSPRIVQGLEELAKIVHPMLFT